MIEFAKYDATGAVTAGPINGQTWHGIRPSSRFWPCVQEWIDAGNTVEAYQEPAEPVPATISDRQFFQCCAVRQLITKEEAIAAVARGEIPVALKLYISQLPEELQFQVEMLLAGATTFERQHPITEAVGQFFGMNAAQIDQFWIDANTM